MGPLQPPRINEFITKIKPAGEDGQAALGGKEVRAGKRGRGAQEEPKTLEEAQARAELCTKCSKRLDGSKGCQQCMGEFFQFTRKRLSSKTAGCC